MDQLIRCKNCGELFMKSPFDQYPEYHWDLDQSPGTFRTIERDDFQDFLSHHRGHQLEDLEIIEDSFVSDKTYSEPIKTSFFKATNGKERFVIKRFREKIDEPLKYQLVSGDYSLECTSIEIQSEEIAKQLRREVNPPLSQTQISAFLKLYRSIAEDIELKDLERIPEESSHPLEVFYKMDDIHLMYLLRNCRNGFKGQDYLAIERFIHQHKDDGVLLLKATFKIDITEVAQPKRKAIPIPLPSREKIVSKK